MKSKVKVVFAALCAVGLVAPAQQALADTITPPAVVPPTAQTPTTPTSYTVTYPVTVTITGQAPQTVNFIYDSSSGNWFAPNGWNYTGQLNQNANTATFSTTQGGVTYGIALSSTGTGFVPSQGAVTTTPPSVGVNLNGVAVTSTALPNFGAATATGTVTGVGISSAPLSPQGINVQVIGLNPNGQIVGTATLGTPIGTVAPAAATSGPGSAAGSIVVNSNSANSSVGYGSYTITIPQTATPSGTSTVSGTIAGNAGSFGSSGIFVGAITGTATYNTTTGVVNASPANAAGFSVNASGNTMIGCTAANSATTPGLTVCNGTTTNGIVNTGNVATTTLNVSGLSTTNGIANTGQISTTTLVTTGNATVGGALGVTGNATVGGTLGVTGATTTNGITNTGNIATTTLSATGNATVGGTLGVTGNTTLGGTLAVTGATTTNGITNTGNISNSGNLTNTGNATVGGTMSVAGATTLGGTATGGNTATVNSSGVTLASGTNSSVALTSSGATVTGGTTSLSLNSTRAAFAGAAGAPVTVTGIANGSSQFDAVNFGQLHDLEKLASRGIASATALANIPQVGEGKQFAIGAGIASFNSETAFAIGASAKVGAAGIIKASVGTGSGSGKAAYGLGGAWSF